MEIKKISTKIQEIIMKYKFPILVLLIGILLMLIPGKSVSAPKVEESTQSKQQQRDIGKELEQILSKIQGVGRVNVMLTQAAGESYLYQTDEDLQMSDGSSSSQKDTVIITDSDRNQTPVISQILPPKYLGAIIVCQGAEDASVKLAVVEAVSRITGLGADMICVLKMK